MPSLIIGHTTKSSVLVWVRGDRTFDRANIVLSEEKGSVARWSTKLRVGVDYTATHTFAGLSAARDYAVSVWFASCEGGGSVERRGRVRTFPESDDLGPVTFLLGSCNLSVSTVHNLAGLLSAAFGTIALREALDRPFGWRFGLLDSLVRTGLRMVLGLLLRYYGRRPSRFRRSFESPTRVKRRQTSARRAKRARREIQRLTSPFARLTALANKERPAFTLHVGDQIYFDVPERHRRPTLEAYAESYRDAWETDRAAAEFLALCPQYMTLDDHEIIDQYAVDQIPSSAPCQPEEYAKPALDAYRLYVHQRHPTARDDRFDYTFDCGRARFFVLNTRTERRYAEPEMISEDQLRRLKAWLLEDSGAVKLVVSSVPFVAEVRGSTDRRKSGQLEAAGAYASDKWSAEEFRTQRKRILQFICCRRLSNVVFLTGDMHCCYHASIRMRATDRPGRDRIEVHELASGPLHQLRLGRRTDFFTRYGGVLRGPDIHYDARLQNFHSGTSAAMRVRLAFDPGGAVELRWQVERLLDTLDEPDTRRATRPGRPISGVIDL